MATVSPTEVARPFVPPEKAGPAYGTIAITTGDDLNLTKRPGRLHRTLEVTANTAVTALNTITNGEFVGQMLTFIVVGANTLRVPAALGNVGATVNFDVLANLPRSLMWNGTLWYPMS